MIRLALQEKVFEQAGTAVLADVDLDVKRGEFVALLGPSGVGKTTLLRILAGLDTRFSGTLQYGEEWDGGRPGNARRIAFLFQEPRLMPWLTALENIALVQTGDTQLALDALQTVGLEEHGSLYPHQLSGGMQRRVALARAIAHEPDLLLLDEPFVSLDEPATRQLHALLTAYWQKRGLAVLLVSHNLDEALALADRLLFLGGSPAHVLHEYRPPVARPRSIGSGEIATLRESVLRDHPDLLAGYLGQGR